jgi:hypothetical protein
MMSGSRRIWALFLLVSSLSIGFLGLQSVCFARVEASMVELPPMSLTVVGADMSAVILNETDVAALPSYRAYGGYKNQLGNLKGLGNYTGVSLSTLCNLVGGLTNTSTVKIVAVDNYNKTFTFDEVNGEFITYDHVTGEEVPHNQPLVPIVAYYFNDASFPSSDGPLRTAIVGPEGLVTGSTHWVKQVVRIEVIDAAVPEFPSYMILPLLLLVTLVAALVLKTNRQRLDRLTNQD